MSIRSIYADDMLTLDLSGSEGLSGHPGRILLRLVEMIVQKCAGHVAEAREVVGSEERLGPVTAIKGGVDFPSSRDAVELEVVVDGYVS